MHFEGNSEDDLTTTGDLTTRLGVVNMLSGCYVQCITCASNVPPVVWLVDWVWKNGKFQVFWSGAFACVCLLLHFSRDIN